MLMLFPLHIAGWSLISFSASLQGELHCLKSRAELGLDYEHPNPNANLSLLGHTAPLEAGRWIKVRVQGLVGL